MSRLNIKDKQHLTKAVNSLIGLRMEVLGPGQRDILVMVQKEIQAVLDAPSPNGSKR